MASEVSTCARNHFIWSFLRAFLLPAGATSSFSCNLQSFFVGTGDVAENLEDFVALLGVRGRAVFDVAANIHMIVEIVRILPQRLGKLYNGQLNQRGTADRLLHAQLAAFHAAGQIHFAFAGEQRHRAHFAKVNADRIVCVNRLFNLLLRVKKVRFRFRIEEFSSFFVEINP